MTTQHATRSRQADSWVMLALLWLVYASFGLVGFSTGVLVTPIVDDLKLTHSEMGLVLGSWQLIFIAASIICGRIIDRWGMRKSVLAGIALVVISAGLRSVATSFATILPAVAIFGAGMPMASVGGPKAVALWFEGGKRGIALGIYMTGAWAGALGALSLTNSVVMPLVQDNWRTVILSYGIVVLVIGILWSFLYKDKSIEVSRTNTGFIRTLGQIVRIRNVQLALLAGVATAATTHGLGWLPQILETGGMTPAAAGFAVSANTLAGIPAVLVLPRVIPVRFRGRALGVAALGATLGLCGTIGSSGWVQFVALLVTGFAVSAFFPLLLMILMDSSGIPSEYLGAANGVFFSVAQVGGFVAPLMVGALFDLTDGFMSGMLLLALLNAAMIPIVLSLRARSSGATQQTTIAQSGE